MDLPLNEFSESNGEMIYLSELTQSNIESIRCAINDTLGEYSTIEQRTLQRISDKLREVSVYSLSNNEMNLVCSCLHDSLHILDDLGENTDDIRSYRSELEMILGVMQRSTLRGGHE